MKLPNGAESVIAARKKGMKPAELLIVSLVGKTGEANHTIYANPQGEYDWRWLVGLQVCVYVNNATQWRDILVAIAKSRPQLLCLYNVDQFKGAYTYYLPRVEDIEKPKSQWRNVLDFLPWTNWQNDQFAWGD